MKIDQLLVGILMFTMGGSFAESQPTDGFFPYVKGRYWLFDGVVEYAQNHEVINKKITGWKSEVLDTVEGKDFKAALIKGQPSDLAWYEENKQRSVFIVILTASGDFYDDIRMGDDTTRQFAEIKSTGKLSKEWIDAIPPFFKTQMKVDDRFGDPEQTKLGPRYCWVVDHISPEKPDTLVKGIVGDKEFATYTLIYRSSPEHMIVKFAAGLGVVSYQYVHHGTAGNCEMHLAGTGVSPQ